MQADVDFPHKSQLSCHQNLNAFSDWLYEELAILGEEGVRKVLVVWHHADKIVALGALEDLLYLVTLFTLMEELLKGLRLRVVLLREDEAV